MIRFGAEVFTGLPAIAIGIFAYTVIVTRQDTSPLSRRVWHWPS